MMPERVAENVPAAHLSLTASSFSRSSDMLYNKGAEKASMTRPLSRHPPLSLGTGG